MAAVPDMQALSAEAFLEKYEEVTRPSSGRIERKFSRLRRARVASRPSSPVTALSSNNSASFSVMAPPSSSASTIVTARL